MTRVDFYVLEHGDAERHDQVMCRVVEKAWQSGHRVYVHCASEDAVRAFDERLWRFRDVSFVPHVVHGAGDIDADTPVIIGMAAEQEASPEVLVNLAPAVPDAASRYQRVVESAGHDDATRGAARQRYRHYQERGFPLHTHKVGG